MEKANTKNTGSFEIWDREEFSPGYLEGRVDGFDNQDVSVIISTYNRSPHPVETFANPLGWCLQSLSEQKKGGIGEIIVVDDGSTDYTQEVVKYYQEDLEIPIKFIHNNSNIGSSKSRNIGAENSNFPYLQFLDDDCIFSPYMFFGARQALKNLEGEAKVVHQPIYHRRKKPNRRVNLNEIGVLDLENALIKGGYDAFPVEYEKNLENSIIDKETFSLKPIEIKNIGGVFMIDRDAFFDAKGFPDYFTWRNGYREETDLAIRLREKGHKLFFTPDPKFFCTHLKYGFMSAGSVNGRYNGLAYFVQESNEERELTGNRVPPREWIKSYITSTYFIFNKLGKEAGENFKRKIKDRFIYHNDYSVFNSSSVIENDLYYDERVNMYSEAIAEADNLIKLIGFNK